MNKSNGMAKNVDSLIKEQMWQTSRFQLVSSRDS